ncbi:MAG TPA: pyridoxal phosphate-dependent aminotransferase [Allosphingosinicella sp.]|nr:pyridoxal phosphate-dependent aminotransferase [Allosphingosinicella sp.]
MRALQSEYMHWAKTQTPVTYHLASSEVPHFRLDRFPIDIADLDLTGASHYRYPPLREAIARKCGVDPGRVVMADGTSMANMLAMAALIEPGDEVLVEQPAYEPLLAAARFLGADIRAFTRQGPAFALDIHAIEQSIHAKTRLILATNLHNPTGNLADIETLRALAGLGVPVLIDEVYLDAAGQPTAHLLGDNIVATSSLTKVYGLSGLRCGWILAAPALAEKMWRLNELFGVAQAHADERLSCLALSRLPQIAAEAHAHLPRNRALANTFFATRHELEAAPMVHNVTAFPRLLSGDPDRLHDLLRSQYDTSIVPGRFFGASDHFRIGIGGPTEIVEEGLARLGLALDALA